MSEYRRIDNVYEAASAYAEIVNVFGKAVFRDKYRTIGAFMDIAPKMKEEATYLIKSFDAGVPQLLADASGLNENKCKELVGKLKDQGLPEDIALDLMENLCQAMGIEATVRPDYSKGGMIPYVTKEGEGLQEAIAKLDHIRWLLNNSGNYHIRESEKELIEMRKLMGNPQRNETELRDRYNKLVHKFQNDPFTEGFILEKKQGTEITSKEFGSYFIVVEGTPVTLEFARLYGGEAYTNGVKKLKTKYESMSRKIGSYYREASALDLPLNNAGKKRKAVIFIVVALLVIHYMKKMLEGRWEGVDPIAFWGVLKENHFEIWKVLPGILSVSYPLSYSAILIVSLMLICCVVVLLISLCKTLWNVCMIKGTKQLYKKKNKLIVIFGKTIPDKLEFLMEQMNQYISGEKKNLEIAARDYSSYVLDIQNLKNEKAPTGMDSFVPGTGFVAFVWMIIFSVALWVMGGGQLKSDAVVCASELGGAVAFREAISDTIIPQKALVYEDHFYAVYDDAPTWEAARDQCEKLGGHLVTITSEEEEIAVASYLKKKDLECVFTGLKYTDTGRKSGWRWLGKKKVSYKDWADDEPDLGEEEDCLYGAFSQKDDYKWRALPKDYTTYYVCEWDSLDEAKVDKRLLNIPVGSLKYNGHYYAILDGAETYDDAVEMCKNLDGYMCMIDDKKENKTLYKYIHSHEYEDVYFGYSDQSLEGKWVWAYTDAPGEYTKWSDGEPNGDTEENYGMFYSGSDKYCWNDKNWDGEDSLFLCEWDPELWNVQTDDAFVEQEK